jgi:hypothetical protein
MAAFAREISSSLSRVKVCLVVGHRRIGSWPDHALFVNHASDGKVQVFILPAIGVMAMMDKIETTIALGLLLAAGVMIYFMPAIMAFNDTHPKRVAILLLNLFLGWTLVGWIAAMIWVATASRRNGR